MTSKAEFARAEAFIDSCIEPLHLGGWSIELKQTTAEEEGEQDTSAIIWMKDSGHRAEVHLSENWSTFPVEKRRVSLIHELLHCHTGRIIDPFERFREDVGRLAFDPAYAEAQHRMEEATDDLARVLARWLPGYPE